MVKKVLYAGVDWASATHAACVVDQAGMIRARFQVPNTGKTFTGLSKRLAKLAVAGVATWPRPTSRPAATSPRRPSAPPP